MKRFFLLTIALFLMMGAAVAGVYESDFTEGTDGWYARGTGECAIEVTEVGLYTYGRTGTWNSPGRQFPLIPGEDVLIRIHVVSTTRSLIHLSAESYPASAPDRLCLSSTGIYFYKPKWPQA